MKKEAIERSNKTSSENTHLPPQANTHTAQPGRWRNKRSWTVIISTIFSIPRTLPGTVVWCAAIRSRASNTCMHYCLFLILYQPITWRCVCVCVCLWISFFTEVTSSPSLCLAFVGVSWATLSRGRAPACVVLLQVCFTVLLLCFCVVWNWLKTNTITPNRIKYAKQ